MLKLAFNYYLPIDAKMIKAPGFQTIQFTLYQSADFIFISSHYLVDKLYLIYGVPDKKNFVLHRKGWISSIFSNYNKHCEDRGFMHIVLKSNNTLIHRVTHRPQRMRLQRRLYRIYADLFYTQFWFDIGFFRYRII